MMVDRFLNKHGAFGSELESVLGKTFDGWRRCRCPKCSDARKNKTDRCLGVRHPEEGDIYVICHNCGWRSGFDGPNASSFGVSGRSVNNNRNSRKSGGLRLKTPWY